MEILPIDVTAIVAIVLGMLVVLIPIAGLTARYALKPLVESFARLFDVQNVEETLRMSERRMALMEQQIEGLEGEVRRLRETQEFDTALLDGAGARRIPGPTPEPVTEGR